MAAAVAALGVGLVGLGVTHLHHAPRQLPRSFASHPSVSTSATTSVSPEPSSAGYSGQSPPGSGAPVRVRIHSLHVDAVVVPVRSADSEIEVPADPATLGWWIGGATPGSLVGATVIVGHVDSAATGPGALFHLDRVRPGDTIEVTVTGGALERYTVSALHTVAKSVGIGDAALDDAGPAQLTLITCGGTFDRRARSYRDNIVVTAEPVV